MKPMAATANDSAKVSHVRRWLVPVFCGAVSLAVVWLVWGGVATGAGDS